MKKGKIRHSNKRHKGSLYTMGSEKDSEKMT